MTFIPIKQKAFILFEASLALYYIINWSFAILQVFFWTGCWICMSCLAVKPEWRPTKPTLRQSRTQRYELYLATTLTPVTKRYVCCMASIQLTLGLDLLTGTFFFNKICQPHNCLHRLLPPGEAPNTVWKPSQNFAVPRSCRMIFAEYNDSVILSFFTALTVFINLLYCILSLILHDSCIFILF